MATRLKRRNRISRKILVLGAGASRSVSYARLGWYPSPLDSDFFDLLQRSETSTTKNASAVKFILTQIDNLPHEYRHSMERTFYTLHLRAYLSSKLGNSKKEVSDEEIVENFARCIQHLLRKAHGKEVCQHHVNIFKALHAHDTIISFNYDLVIERALKQFAKDRNAEFGKWLYGFGDVPGGADLPVTLKLHGSSNWKLSDGKFHVLTRKWEELDELPGYQGHQGTGTEFPIFLPFWDKRIEHPPWLDLWKNAFNKLQMADEIIVWGYSLPPTDVKAEQLFSLTKGNKQFKLCVIDPSNITRERWRELFLKAQYWGYENIKDFLKQPPLWWQ